MAAGPQRAARPAAHVTAHIAPVERALLARASEIEKDDVIASANMDAETVAVVQVVLAAEFRALAAELHHW